MLNWLRREEKNVSLEDYLNRDQTKTIKVCGVIFKIRKINPLDYLDGSKAVKRTFDTYQVGNPDSERQLTEGDIKKIKSHYSDVILAGVLEPAIVRKKEEEGIWVENLFTDWELADKLYTEIMLYTHGKKKAT